MVCIQSAFKWRGLVKIISVVQIVLAVAGLVLLFTAEFGNETFRFTHTNLYAGNTYYSYETLGEMYNLNAAMWSLTAGFIVLFVIIVLLGFRWGWLSSGQIAAKYAKLTIVLGLLVIVLSLVAAAVAFITRYDAWTASIPAGVVSVAKPGEVSWSLGTALTSFLVGGFLFIVIGFIGTRMTRTAQLPPPPPPPPPLS